MKIENRKLEFLKWASSEITQVVPFNFLIGPSAADLIIYGAKYAPCMRSDTRIFAALAKQREAEFGTLGCCEVTVSHRVLRIAGCGSQGGTLARSDGCCEGCSRVRCDVATC